MSNILGEENDFNNLANNKTIYSNIALQHSNPEQQILALEKKLIDLSSGKDSNPLSKKVAYYDKVISPIVKELAKYSLYPTPESQLSALAGVWRSLWTTAPFQDIIPGRLRDQSYQIFDESNYYANIARYLPTTHFKFLSSFFIPVYDLMILQQIKVENSQWIIQNIGVKQAVHKQSVSTLTSEKAQEWFKEILLLELKNDGSNEILFLAEPESNEMNKKWHRMLKSTYKAKPFFEHLYMSRNLRIVKTHREANQRASYTIAVRVN